MIDSAIFAFGKCDSDRVTESQRNAKIRVEGIADIRVKDSGLRATAMRVTSEGSPAVGFAAVRYVMRCGYE